MRLPRSLKRYILSSFFALLTLLFSWVAHSENTITLPGTGFPADLYSTEDGDDLRLVYLKAINEAKQSILLFVYTLNDDQIIKALKSRSEQGIAVKVVVDAKASPLSAGKLGKKVDTLRRFGSGLMHQKILVIDQSLVWIGSANMTSESLRMYGNLVTALNSPAIAKQVTEKAKNMTDCERLKLFPHTEYTVGKQSLELWFLPDDQEAVARIKTLIRSAKKTIRVAMFMWTRVDLAHEIIQARNRGVKVEVAIDNKSGHGSGAAIVALLKKEGVDVTLSKGNGLLHHKMMIIDSKTLVNGSANWTKRAFKDNDDCFLVLTPLNKAQKDKLERLWKNI